MNKFRVIEVRRGTKVHYEVQKKIWIFWYTETYFDCSIDGFDAGEYSFVFESLEKAKQYITDNYPIVRIVVYEQTGE